MALRLRHFLLFHFFALSVASPAVTVAPVGQVALLDASAEFNCTTVEGPAIWIINGSQYVANTEEPHRARGIVRTIYWIRGRKYFTVLRVTASWQNNNTEIKCRAAASNAESSPVHLKVQGPLDAPTNLSILTVNMSTILVSWAPPFTLDGIKILGYIVTVKNSVQEVIFSTNLTFNEYYYSVPSCHYGHLQVYVAGCNDLGTGLYSNPVDISHGKLLGSWGNHIVVIALPETVNLISSIIPPSHFSCKSLCDNSLIVLWMINGTLLRPEGSNMTRSSNYHKQCLSNGRNMYDATLEVVTNIPTPFTVQCVGICVCREVSTTCTTRPSYSHTVQVDAVADDDFNATTLSITAEGKEAVEPLKVTTLTASKGRAIQIPVPEHSGHTPVLTATIIAAFFAMICLILLAILCGLICIRKRRKDLVSSPARINQEVMYEQCGEPVKKETCYDEVPSLLTFRPDLQTCQAYTTCHPRQDLQACPAYDTSSHPTMEFCAAYSASHKMCDC